MDKSIFRAYDIRGIYPTELDEQDAYRITRATFKYARPKRVAVGRDARLSAPQIHKAVCQGFKDSGCEVFDCGMTATDSMAWLSGSQDFDITVNVTASHNPADWIGMKISSKGGDAVGGAGEIQEIGEIALKLDYEYQPTDGLFEQLDLLPGWIGHVLSFVDASKMRPLKIVVDAGNGVAGPIVRELFKHLPVELVELYFEPDGNFPNHLPSPIEPKNVADLQKKVLEAGADLGMAFDGDADRVFLVDERSGIVTGSEMTALVADEVLSQDPGRIILYNAICGWNVRDVIAKHKATAHRTMVGHGYIKKDMKKYGAYFAGEHSGHYFFQENYNCDSGLIAAVFVLALLSKEGRTLSEVLIPHRRYFQIPETNFKVQDVQVVLNELQKKYASNNIDKLDGLTIQAEDWWCNVRPSSNEPLLRLNLEAKDKATLEQMAQELTNLITQPTRVSV